MSNFIKKIKQLGFTRANINSKLYKLFLSDWFLAAVLHGSQKKKIILSDDPVRFGAIYLAISQIIKEGIPGSFAECGVYKGKTSKYINGLINGQKYYLFDTFEGFPDKKTEDANDKRFRDTSLDDVLSKLGDAKNIIIRKGIFPETARGLDNEKFAFVMLDFDKYEPTLSALEFFYPKMSKGGHIFVHDYNNTESDWACSMALDHFIADKIEKIIALPDTFGSAMFRKL